MKKLITFLRETYPPKSFIYYNNPGSIKIQLPTLDEKQIIDYLDNNNIIYNIERPEFIQKNLYLIPNHTTIRIKKRINNLY